MTGGSDSGHAKRRETARKPLPFPRAAGGRLTAGRREVPVNVSVAGKGAAGDRRAAFYCSFASDSAMSPTIQMQRSLISVGTQGTARLSAA